MKKGSEIESEELEIIKIYPSQQISENTTLKNNRKRKSPNSKGKKQKIHRHKIMIEEIFDDSNNNNLSKPPHQRIDLYQNENNNHTHNFRIAPNHHNNHKIDEKAIHSSKKKQFKTNLSFPIDNFTKNSKTRFKEFSVFVQRETGLKEINDEFFESQSILDCTLKYTKHVQNLTISDNNKKSHLSGIKSFLLGIIENTHLMIDKQYLRMCVIHLNEKKKDFNQEKKKIQKKKISPKLSFSWDSFSVEQKTFFNHFLGFVERHLGFEGEINDHFLESSLLLDFTIKYSQFVVSDPSSSVSFKRDSLNFLLSFFNNIIKNKDLKLQKFYLESAVVHLQTEETNLAKHGNLQNKSFQTKITNFFSYNHSKTTVKNFLALSFSVDSFNKNYKLGFTFFAKFVKLETEFEQINDQFLQSNTLLDCVENYCQHLASADRLKEVTKIIYSNYLIKFFSLVVDNQQIKIDKTFLIRSVTLIESYKNQYYKSSQKQNNKRLAEENKFTVHNSNPEKKHFFENQKVQSEEENESKETRKINLEIESVKCNLEMLDNINKKFASKIDLLFDQFL